MIEYSMGVLRDDRLENLLSGFHETSNSQLDVMMSDYQKIKEAGTTPGKSLFKQYLSDKFVALDRDKAEFCYQLCRAIGARRIVEAGSSFGVSTLYLAAALRDNIRHAGGSGVVIGTEHEQGKVAAAK